MEIRLIAKDGFLYFPFGGYNDEWQVQADAPDVLVHVYPAGDCDTCPWPMVSEFATADELRKRLAGALFAERETNDYFPSDAKILLPDGTVFEFDRFVA